ncbi:PREDICTED: C-type lectin 37Db-like [Nicrophorus vespilloides]|uniref:C-type lectin 37Db-like n=1 Tax=Nicrophorus vespilloides TaxID=110193 RepID=A0ABM1M0Z6_NICVS|nr:PREDICTED: C-type lectin 37Db-like [Nicrophorus vespilloides]
MNLKLLTILLVALDGSSTLTFVRRSPFHYEYKDIFYYFETFYKATWFKAFMSCSKMGMQLLSIDSDEEFDKIHEFLKDKIEYKPELSIWTSGAMKRIGQFNWINTGYPVRLSKWHPGEPNNYGGREYCLKIWINDNRFLLDDDRCDREMHFICESRKSSSDCIFYII